MNNEQNNGVGNITPIMPNNANNQNTNPGVNNEQSGVTTPTPITPIAPTTPEQQNNQVPNNNPTIPIIIIINSAVKNPLYLLSNIVNHHLFSIY